MNHAPTPAALLIACVDARFDRDAQQQRLHQEGLRPARTVELPARTAILAREIRRCWQDGLTTVWIVTGPRHRCREATVAAAGMAFNCLTDGELPVGAAVRDDPSCWELADDRHRLIVTVA